MTSAHRHPPPPPNSQSDFRLPSLKDLNFYRPSGGQPALQLPETSIAQQEQPPSQPARHPATWSRSTPNPYPPPPAQPPYPDVPTKVEYSSSNIAYAIPFSAQPNAVPVAMQPRREQPMSHPHSPNLPKRQRTASSSSGAATRDGRPSHVCASFFGVHFALLILNITA
jgi:hypothetical protein